MNFKSCYSYHEFAWHVWRNSRYILDSEAKNFLDTLVWHFSKRVLIANKGDKLWRSQLGYGQHKVNIGDGHTGYQAVPHPRKRMKPIPEKVSDGRVNPAGIPYLYLSCDKNTAMSEVRPWLEAMVSVCVFELVKDIRLVDFTKHKGPNFHTWWEEPTDPDEINGHVLKDIDHAFSRPVAPSDDATSYIPTQIIAERMKHEGFDGIAFRSSLNEKGINIVLFDLDAAEIISCHLFETKKIEFEFAETGNPYYVQKEAE